MRIAVVGSGVSGLAATWALNEYSDHEVHLYEADNRPGGHANTVVFTSPKDSSSQTNVDTGFIVCNPPSYPNFLRFLEKCGISRVPTEMTFSVSRDRGAFEWAGDTIFTVFCQPQNLFRAAHWRMIWDVLRFNACARLLVQDSESGNNDMSIGDYLIREGYSDSFRDDYLIPMTAAIWSTPPDKCSLDFPVLTLLRFMYNHHLLQLTGKPAWLTIPGGSHTYVKRILAALPKSQLHLSTSVEAVWTTPTGVRLDFAGLPSESFDAVVLATHSDTTLRILQQGGWEGKHEGASEEEARILESFRWSRNEAVLHFDDKLMPVNRSAWSCWNYLTSSSVDSKGVIQANVDQVALTYSMNLLQHISEDKFGPVLVTLNPPFEPDPETVIGRWNYEHPIVSASGVKAQNMLSNIQNKRGITFAGAWTKYGFHEDGFTSGIRVASAYLGAQLPFEINSPDREVLSNSREKSVALVMEGAEFFRKALSWLIFSLLLRVFSSGYISKA